MAFVPDKPLSFVPDKPAAPSRVSGLEENLLGPSELLGSAAANIPGGAINAASDLAHRLGGNDSAAPLVPSVPTGAAARQLMSDIASVVHPAGGGQERPLDPNATHPDLGSSPNPLSEDARTTLEDVAGQAGKVVSDVGAIAPAVGIAKAAVGIPAEIAAARTAAAAPIGTNDIEGALQAVGYKNLPRQGGGSTGAQLGARIAGEPTVAASQTLNNQAVTTQLAKHEAGVPPGSPMDYTALTKARLSGPGKVYNAAHDALPPTLTQDGPLQQAIASVGDTTSQLPRSPDVDALKQTMLSQPEMSRDQLFANIQQARDRASRFFASDQPDAHAIGDAYQSVANSYEDFVGRQLAANPVSPVSLSDWQDARTAFAKNYAVQTALKGTDVDASKLAALQRKDPGRLTGGLQLIAEQQNRYPLSTGFGPTTFEQGGVGASGSLEGNVARHVTGPMVGAGLGAAFGGPAGAAIGGAGGLLGSAAFQGIIRRVLGGSPAKGAALADAATSDPRLADFFNPPEPPAPPTPPLELRPPPGKAFEPHQPELATGATPQRDFFGFGAGGMDAASPTAGAPPVAGHPGDISLADLLSHGVEQEPSAGLSAGPMGAPVEHGIPYKPDAHFMSGPLSLADDLAGPSTQQRNASAPAGEGEPPQHPTLKDLMEELSQHPDVMSQGVPEGIMTRTANNASAESPASLEAINRTRREQAEGQDRFLIDPDGKMWPVRGVEAADATAPKGSILVQKGIGGEPYSILDRGGLPRANAHGLLNRALAGGHGMTLSDLLSGDSG